MPTVPGSYLGAPKLQLFDDDGNPVAGGKLYSYQAGTSTPQATYTDVDLLVANANPTILDDAGRAVCFLYPVSYKFVLTDADDVQLWEQDFVADIGQNFFNTLGITVGSPFAPPIMRTLVSGNTQAASDQVILVNSTGGANPCIVNLMPAADCVQPWVVIKNLGTVALAITPDGTDLLDLVAGVYTIPVAVPPLYPSITIASNGTNGWYILSALGLG